MGTPRKIVMAVYCDSDEQATAVQNIAKEFCSTFSLNAVDILCLYPMLKKNKGLLKEAIKVVQKEGKGGIIRLVPSLVKAFM